MRKRLLTALALVATSFFGVSSAWAQSYVSTTTNASDDTKQDVTYTFNDASNYASDGVTVGSDVVATLYDGTTTTNLYKCTTTGLDRFAFHAANGTSISTGKWWWRTSGTDRGLQNRGGSSATETTAEGFAITGLKAGDVVVVNGKNLTYGSYATLLGAEEIDGTTNDSPTKGEGEASYTVTTSATQYTFNVTSDGYIAMAVYRYMYSYIQSVVITEDKPDMADPTGEVTGTSGESRIVELSCTTEGASIYYSETELTTAEGGTLYESAITTSAETIYAYATDGTTTSNVVTISTGAGTSVSLNAATFANLYYDASTATYSVKVSDDQSAILGAPTATLTYTIDGGDETSVTSGNYITGLTAGNVVVVTATADGYASTESTYTVASTGAESINVSALWSDNFESTSALTTSGSFTIGSLSYSIATAIGDTELSGNSGFYAYSSTRYKPTEDGITTSNNYYVGVQNVTTDDEYYVAVTVAGESLTNALITGRQNVSSTISVLNADGTATIYFKPSSTSMSFNAYSGLVIKSIALAGPYITKTLGDSRYGTFSADFDAAVPDGITVYTATTSEDETSLVIEPVEDITVIPASTGVVIKGTANTPYDFVKATETASEISADNIMVANVEATAAGEGWYGLLLATESAAPITSGTTLGANTAYFTLSSSAKSLRIMTADEATTAIANVEAATADSDAACYNVLGQRVNATAKGLVIKNGKKYVNK